MRSPPPLPMFVLAILLGAQCLLFDIVTAYRSPGEISPSSVEAAIGEDVIITCRMNLEMFAGQDSSSLYFERADGSRVPANQIQILNKSSIALLLRNAARQDEKYVCKCGDKGIAEVAVTVGNAPTGVKDFRCASYDFQYMVCNFTKPANTLRTTYKLRYVAANPQSQSQSKGIPILKLISRKDYHYDCNLNNQVDYAVCNLTLQDVYKRNYEYYNFTLKAYNSAGNHSQHIIINQYKCAIPPRPDVTFSNASTNSIMLSWNLITHGQYSNKSKKRLIYDVQLQPRGKPWRTHTNFRLLHAGKTSLYQMLLRDLPYAFYAYQIRLRMRVLANPHTWSEPFVGEFMTDSRIPDEPPRTTAGMFRDAEKSLRLYWHELPRHSWNGPNFTYEVTQLEPSTQHKQTILVDRPPAVVAWRRHLRYEFEIVSRNAAGRSMRTSRLVVPASNVHTSFEYEPQRIEKIYNDPNRTYTLSWSAPPAAAAAAANDNGDLINYTVFWCEKKFENNNECNGTMFFANVTRDTLKYTTAPQENPLNMAVSANFGQANVGMHWAMCTVHSDMDMVKMEVTLDKKTATTMQLKWSPDPICTSLLKGYQLMWCKVNNNNTTTAPPSGDCDGASHNITIEATARQYILGGLQPFTTYKMSMLMFASEQKKGLPSDPLVNRTDEAAPSPPRFVRCQQVTSNSAVIVWQPPEQANGIIRAYRIFHNNSIADVLDCTQRPAKCPSDPAALITFQLHGLRSYQPHNVYVVAETVRPSAPSNAVDFTTLIGVPSVPREHSSGGPSIMEWQRPEDPAGLVDFYEVAVVRWLRNQKLQEHISIVANATACTMLNTQCTDPVLKHTFHVRAVNVAAANHNGDMTKHRRFVAENEPYDVAADDEPQCVGGDASALLRVRQYLDHPERYTLYRSDWKNGTVYGCQPPTRTASGPVFYFIFVMIGLLATVFVFVGRVKWVKMANISCKLPDNLDSAAIPVKGECGGSDGEFGFSPAMEKEITAAFRHTISVPTTGPPKSRFNLPCDEDVLTSTENAFLLPNAHHKRGGGPMDERSALGSVCSSGYNTSEHTPCLDDQPSDVYTVMACVKPKEEAAPREEATFGCDSTNIGDCNGYVQQSQLEELATLAHHRAQMGPPPESSYVKPNQWYGMAWPHGPGGGFGNVASLGADLSRLEGGGEKGLVEATEISPPKSAAVPFTGNGYITPQAANKPMDPSIFTSDGYTKEEAYQVKTPPPGVAPHQGDISLKHLNAPAEMGTASGATHPRNPPPNHLPVISGYVTQRDMSALAHHMRMS